MAKSANCGTATVSSPDEACDPRLSLGCVLGSLVCCVRVSLGFLEEVLDGQSWKQRVTRLRQTTVGTVMLV